MKVLEHILNTIIRKQKSIDNMQFDFMPGGGATDAIFIIRQLQEKCLHKKKNIYLAFVDLEKAFDRVTHTAIWWAMQKLGIDEWIIQIEKIDLYMKSKQLSLIEKCICLTIQSVNSVYKFSEMYLSILKVVSATFFASLFCMPKREQL